MNIEQKQLKLFLVRTGKLLETQPILIVVACLVLSLAFLLFVWWQYIFNLPFDHQEIFVQESFLDRDNLMQVRELSQKREAEFQAAQTREYRDLFR